MTTLTTAQPITPTVAAAGKGRVLRFRIGVVGAAVLVNSAIYLAGRTLGTDFVLSAAGNPVPHPLVLTEIATISAVFGLLGWGSLALLERVTRRARQVWAALATVVLALSFVPLGMDLASADTRVLLGVMHLVVAAALFPMLRQTRVRG
ncbi:DUF6069 family protein [Plantactinospora sp. B6F1]|uniref:DUF6069 family protein n=1 Tax=Plantactinospora sp. B6F1 TaxID=3158971 RepID=UPI0032D95FA7